MEFGKRRPLMGSNPTEVTLTLIEPIPTPLLPRGSVLTLTYRVGRQNAFTLAITWSTWASVNSGKIGRLMQVAAARSATGNEPSA